MWHLSDVWSDDNDVLKQDLCHEKTFPLDEPSHQRLESNSSGLSFSCSSDTRKFPQSPKESFPETSGSSGTRQKSTNTGKRSACLLFWSRQPAAGKRSTRCLLFTFKQFWDGTRFAWVSTRSVQLPKLIQMIHHSNQNYSQIFLEVIKLKAFLLISLYECFYNIGSFEVNVKSTNILQEVTRTLDFSRKHSNLVSYKLTKLGGCKSQSYILPVVPHFLILLLYRSFPQLYPGSWRFYPHFWKCQFVTVAYPTLCFYTIQRSSIC